VIAVYVSANVSGGHLNPAGEHLNLEQQAGAEFGFTPEVSHPHEPCWLSKGVLGLSPSHVSKWVLNDRRLNAGSI